jgi:hypothetical protein
MEQARDVAVEEMEDVVVEVEDAEDAFLLKSEQEGW